MQPGPHPSAVLAGLDAIRGRQENFYRDLHAHPELSHQEHRTAVPANHSSGFAPVMQPTLDTGTEALVVAALAWLAPHGR